MTDELESAALQDAIFTADVDEEGYVPPTDDDKKSGKKAEGEIEAEVEKEAADKAKKEAKAAEDKKKEEVKPDKIVELEKRLVEAEKENRRLGYALRKDKKETKVDKETPLTKTQLMQIYKDNQENPEVLFQVVEEMTKLGKVDATLAAEKSADIKTKKLEMDKMLNQAYPDVKDEGSSLHADVKKAIDWLHLEDHPFADYLAFGALALHSLPKTIEDIKAKAKAEALKMSEKELAEKAEKARKKNIDASKPAGKGGKPPDDTKAASLSPDQQETAKRLGLTTKVQLARYAKLVGSKSGTIQTED